MKRLAYELTQLCDAHDRGGSFVSRADRKKQLQLIGRQLHALGFKHVRVHQLGGRHIVRLVRLWFAEGASIGTLKNRMSHLRWWAERIGRGHILARHNSDYGIPSRPLITTSRATELTDEVLAAIDGPFRKRIRVSLRLQRWLGLRLEESLKFRPGKAIVRDEHGHIMCVNLRGSWCKNGRPRTLRIRTDAQRDALEDAFAIAGDQSLIPSLLRYREYKNKVLYRCRKAGLTHRHGLRHRYAQERYKELTGSLPPNCNGRPELWAVDDQARRIISDELGHGRTNVTSAYLGKRTRSKKEEQQAS